MRQQAHKLINRQLRHRRVRAVVHGTAQRPRLSVFISNRQVTAQLIDDTKNATLVYVSTIGQKKPVSGNLTDRAGWVGGEVADQAKKLKIKQVVFDRGSRLYHGRVQALATAAREKGLDF